MGDSEDGAAGHQTVECFLNLLLCLCVDAARGFVQNENPWVVEDSTRDRDTLPLATGQRMAALTDDRIVAVRKLANEVVRVGCARCLWQQEKGVSTLDSSSYLLLQMRSEARAFPAKLCENEQRTGPFLEVVDLVEGVADQVHAQPPWTRVVDRT